MSSSCTIRPLGSNDADGWARLRLEALEKHPLAFGASVPDDPRILLEIAHDRLRSNDESAVFGAFIDDCLVGTVGIRRELGAKERHKSMIWGMYVTPRNRRSGAGEMLLRAAIHHAHTWAGVEQVHLGVNEDSQEAKRLYERNGFQECGHQPRAVCWQGQYTDAIHMILDLREQ
jgi:RimJ/RimL family protein N-acetyltransferase